MSKRPIVRRLRRAAQEAQSLNATAGGLELDAAAEIERLQQLLRECATILHTVPPGATPKAADSTFKALRERLAGWSAGECEAVPSLPEMVKDWLSQRYGMICTAGWPEELERYIKERHQ